jgi:hypothetical protein
MASEVPASNITEDTEAALYLNGVPAGRSGENAPSMVRLVFDAIDVTNRVCPPATMAVPTAS